jgi:hypothetical protein
MALVSEVAPRANKKYAVALPGPVRLPPSAVESPFSQVNIMQYCYFYVAISGPEIVETFLSPPFPVVLGTDFLPIKIITYVLRHILYTTATLIVINVVDVLSINV